MFKVASLENSGVRTTPGFATGSTDVLSTTVTHHYWVRCPLLWRVFYNKPDENLSIQSEDMAEKGDSVQLHFLTLTFDLTKI